MINMLLDELPETVEIGGNECPINTDFRYSVLFEMMMQDEDVPKKEKTIKALELYYPILPPMKHVDEAVDKLLWFYRAGKKEKKTGRDAETDDFEDRIQRVYSFEHDNAYIYSAFLSQYGIDLQDIPYLHWWKFKALFIALDDDCKISKIMEYRSVTITNDMTKRQKEFYRKMKEVYALPVSESEQEKQDAITQALLNGGDLTGLV